MVSVWNAARRRGLIGADPAALLAHACERRGRKAGDDRKVEAVEENHFRGIGEQVITSCIKLQDVHYAPMITDGSTPPLVGNDHLLPWGSSIHLYLGGCCGDLVKRKQGKVDDDDVKPCVGEHG